MSCGDVVAYRDHLSIIKIARCATNVNKIIHETRHFFLNMSANVSCVYVIVYPEQSRIRGSEKDRSLPKSEGSYRDYPSREDQVDAQRARSVDITKRDAQTGGSGVAATLHLPRRPQPAAPAPQVVRGRWAPCQGGRSPGGPGNSGPALRRTPGIFRGA